MAGYWKGTATEQDSDRTFDAIALIDAQGHAQWLLTRGNLFGNDGFVVSADVYAAKRSSRPMQSARTWARPTRAMRVSR